MQETNREHRKQQECKEINSEVSAVVQNRACMEIHHEFRAASKEPEALQQLNFFPRSVADSAQRLGPL